MIYRVCTVYDSSVGAFMTPFFVRSKMEAIRSFSDACGDEKLQFGKHAKDFTLFYIGDFDDSTGVINCDAKSESLATALQVISQLGEERGR